MQYCSLQHLTLFLSPFNPQLGIVFALAPSLLSFWSYFSSGILGTYWPREFLIQYPIILLFHTVHGILKARTLKWFAIPFSSGPHSVRPLHHDPPVLGCPTGMAWFHWVRQGCGPSVIRLTSFLWVWFQCVCPLMPSGNTYRLTWDSFTLDIGYLFTAAPAKRSRCSLPWMRVISSRHPSWPSAWDDSSRPSCTRQSPLLGREVAPLSRRPWPRMQGSSSRPFLGRRSLAL